MAVTRAELRAVCGQMVGDGYSITMSSGSGTTAVSSGFEDYALSTDDVLNRTYWLVMTTLAGTANSFEERPIENYAQGATGTVTVPRAYSGTVENNDVGELWRIRPSNVNNGITRAIRWLNAQRVYLPVYDETIFVDNLLTNSDMETAGASPPVIANWTAVGSPTVTQDTTRVWHGSNSAKIVASGATGIIEQNIFTSVNIKEIAGKTLRVEGWIHATDADQARLRVTFDGSTYTNGVYHAGKDEWEGPGTMYISATVPDAATEMTVSFEVNDGYTAFCDNLVAWIDPVNRYTLPSAFLRTPRQVLMQASRFKNPRNDDWVLLNPSSPPRSGHLLRLIGRGTITEPSAENSSMELSGSLIDIVAAKTLAYAYQAEASVTNSTNRDEHEHLSAYWDNEASRMLDSGVGVLRDATQIDRAWGVDQSGETRYLTIPAGRW